MMDPAVVFESVTRSFGGAVALDRLDLTVAPGTILGIVGRNGAGKTTALNLMQGILYPDAGRIRVLGLDPARAGLALRERSSLLSEETALYPWMTVGELERFAGAIHPRWDPALAASLRARLELEPAQRIGTLSRGTRAKVALLLAVSCRPELLLLDDPTAGLDPLVRREVLEGILDAVPGEGGTVIYASHLVHDVERIADRVAILDAGRLRYCGSLEELKRKVRRARAVFEGGAPAGISLPGQIDARVERRTLTVVADGAAGDLSGTLRSLGAREVVVEPLPLEEILIAYLRDGKDASHE
jgi:ABC-2 type transport system ATP-binding protein